MDYFNLESQQLHNLDANSMIFGSVKTKTSNDKKNNSFLLIDDGNHTSKTTIKRLLGLSKQLLKADLFYIGSLNCPNNKKLEESIASLIESEYSIIMIGFNDFKLNNINKSNKAICSLNSNFQISDHIEYLNLGFQRHLSFVDTNKTNPLDLGLGELKYNSDLIELAFRNQEYIDCNLNILKRSEIPSNSGANINGLFSEDLCKTLKICGTTSNMKLLRFHGFEDNASLAESEIIADCIWYFLEGSNLNEYEDPSSTTNTKEVLLQSSDLEHDYTFIKSTITDKIWFRSSVADKKYKYIPVSQSDYQKVCQDEIPERLLAFI